MIVFRREVSRAVPVPSTCERGSPLRFQAYQAMTSTGLDTITSTPSNPEAMTSSTICPTMPTVNPSSCSRFDPCGGRRPAVTTTMSAFAQSA